MDVHRKQFLEQKRAEANARSPEQQASAGGEASAFPAEAQLCTKCSMKAVVMMDGCMTCLNCGDSKCG